MFITGLHKAYKHCTVAARNLLPIKKKHPQKLFILWVIQWRLVTLLSASAYSYGIHLKGRKLLVYHRHVHD